MSFNQIVLSVIVPIIIGLGGYLIGAFANRRLVKADISDKVSSSYSKLVDDLQEENKKLRLSIQRLEENYANYNKKLDELSSKYEKLIGENIALRSQHVELKHEYAGHRERSKERLDSLKRMTETKTEIMEAQIREYKQTISLQEERMLILEKSVNGGYKDEILG